MALTAQQKRRVFEIVGVLYADNAYVHNHFGEVMHFADIDTLKDAINTYLDSTLDADSETEVASLITSWDTVRLETVALDGAVDDVQGIRYNSADARERIRELMQVYVPYLDIKQAIDKKSGTYDNRGGGFVSLWGVR